MKMHDVLSVFPLVSTGWGAPFEPLNPTRGVYRPRHRAPSSVQQELIEAAEAKRKRRQERNRKMEKAKSRFRHSTYCGSDDRLTGKTALVRDDPVTNQGGNFGLVLAQFDDMDLVLDGVHLGYGVHPFERADFR